MRTLFQYLILIVGLLSLPAQARVEITYVHNDALGSPVAGTDEQGNVKWRSHYQPYGEETLGERQLFGTRAGYTGHRDDPETGLTYMGARYYSPAIGRFMGVDPVGVDAGNLHSFNRYAYANNNPYRFIDPDGKIAETAFDLVSLGLSVAQFRQDPGLVNGLGVAFDGLATVIPFLPGGFGIIKSVGNGVDAAGDAAKSMAVPNVATQKLSKVKKEVREETIGGGKFTKKTKIIPGKGPGQSRSEMEFVKNREGKLIRSRKFSFDRGNKLQHKKPARGGPEGRPANED